MSLGLPALGLVAPMQERNSTYNAASNWASVAITRDFLPKTCGSGQLDLSGEHLSIQSASSLDKKRERPDLARDISLAAHGKEIHA